MLYGQRRLILVARPPKQVATLAAHEASTLTPEEVDRLYRRDKVLLVRASTQHAFGWKDLRRLFSRHPKALSKNFVVENTGNHKVGALTPQQVFGGHIPAAFYVSTILQKSPALARTFLKLPGVPFARPPLAPKHWLSGGACVRVRVRVRARARARVRVRVSVTVRWDWDMTYKDTVGGGEGGA